MYQYILKRVLLTIPTLIGLARERTGAIPGRGSIDFRVGDMLDPALGRFDHVVAMDSLIHYAAADIARALAALAGRTEGSLVFTVAPRTALLTVMHAAGRLFPGATGRRPSCRSPPEPSPGASPASRISRDSASPARTGSIAGSTSRTRSS